MTHKSNLSWLWASLTNGQYNRQLYIIFLFHFILNHILYAKYYGTTQSHIEAPERQYRFSYISNTTTERSSMLNYSLTHFHCEQPDNTTTCSLLIAIFMWNFCKVIANWTFEWKRRAISIRSSKIVTFPITLKHKTFFYRILY